MGDAGLVPEPASAPGSPLCVLATAVIVRPCLGAAAAHRHRAPATRLVARVVIERPPAFVAGARLQPPPRPFEHGRRRGREEHPERPVKARAGGGEAWPVGAEPDLDAGA